MLDIIFSLIKVVRSAYFSLRDEKVKIANFVEEVMPQQFDNGWQQKLQMHMQKVKILTEELRPFVLKVDGNAPKKLLFVDSLLFLFVCVCNLQIVYQILGLNLLLSFVGNWIFFIKLNFCKLTCRSRSGYN